MSFVQIKSFLKKKYVWLPLLIASIILECIGIASLIGIYAYQRQPTDSLFGSWQYSYELSERSALDTWKKDTIFYNKSIVTDGSSAPIKKTFGEFRARVVVEPDKDGKETIGSKPSVDGKTVGILYINGSIYDAQLDSGTGDISYDPSRSYERKNWQWYHWLGLGSH